MGPLVLVTGQGGGIRGGTASGFNRNRIVVLLGVHGPGGLLGVLGEDVGVVGRTGGGHVEGLIWLEPLPLNRGHRRLGGSQLPGTATEIGRFDLVRHK
jgi:hypothetical protein